MRWNISVELIQRNECVEDAKEYLGRVDTKKWSCQGCLGIFWLSRYEEMDVSRMQWNILVE